MRVAPHDALRLLLLASIGLGANINSAYADHLFQKTWEVRSYVYFTASPEAVAKLLPAEWQSAPIPMGPFKGANVALTFYDQLLTEDAVGQPIAATGRGVVLFVPARDPASGASGSMIVGGFASQPGNVPGPYSVYSAATINMSRSYRTDDAGPTYVNEAWEVVASGDKLRLQVKYDRSPTVPMHVEPRNYSAARPDFYRVYKVDQLTKVVRSTATEDEKADRIEFSASGPHLSAIFDGSEHLVGVASVPVYQREIWLPE